MDEAEQTPKKKSIQVVIRWVGTILSLGVMVFLLYRVGWREAWEMVRSLTWWRIVLAIGLVFVSRLATFGRWHTLLQVQEMKVDPRDSLKLTFAGLFASNVLPTTIGGDVARLAGAIRLGIQPALAAASLVADRLIGMTGMTLALPFAIPAYLESRAVGADMAAAGFVQVAWRRLRGGAAKVFSNFRYWSSHPLILLKALGFTLIHQAAIYLIIKILVEGMGETLPFMQIAGIWSLTYFVSLIPISINGLGLQEVTITNLFSILGGLSTTTTLTLAVLLRILWLIGSLPGAFFLGGVIAGKNESTRGKDIV